MTALDTPACSTFFQRLGATGGLSSSVSDAWTGTNAGREAPRATRPLARIIHAQMYTYCLPSKDRVFQASTSLCQVPISRVIVAADNPGASLPTKACSASVKSPLLTPLR